MLITTRGSQSFGSLEKMCCLSAIVDDAIVVSRKNQTTLAFSGVVSVVPEKAGGDVVVGIQVVVNTDYEMECTVSLLCAG